MPSVCVLLTLLTDFWDAGYTRAYTFQTAGEEVCICCGVSFNHQIEYKVFLTMGGENSGGLWVC